MKKTLLEIVQDVLSNLDSENVNSISDTVEAEQVASIVEQVYYNHVSALEVPEHAGLLNLTAASDNTIPTHFYIPENVRKLECIWYATDSSFTYKEIDFVDVFTFLQRVDSVSSNYTDVTVSGTNIRIKTDRNPDFYTTFDDYTIIMNSYDSSIESTLQESKVRAWGYTVPTFSKTDSYTPDIDATLFPYLISESTSTAFELLKGTASQKMEQAARRTRARVHNDMHRVNTGNKRPNYGRR